VIFDDDGTVFFRQSWLDTALRCGERGRLAITLPEWDEVTSDAAAIGTAAHYGIEQWLKNPEVLSKRDMATLAFDHFVLLSQQEEIKWTKYDNVPDCAGHAFRCAEAWYDGIRPHVPLGGHTEVEFQTVLFTRPDGRKVGIQGTADYVVPPEEVSAAIEDGEDCVLPPELWDWKTASSAYKQRDKQRTAIQPTVYSVAAVLGAFGVEGFTWPVTFRYGVMVRGERASKPQVLEVQRTRAHHSWLLDLLNGYVDLYEGMGTEVSWPRSDDHFLCSQRWCPWWSICKGARLSIAEDVWRPDSAE
jgi:hypothetical protein